MRAKVQQQPRHHLHVADPRHIGKDALFLGEETRREDRERGVLVAFDVDGPRQTLPAFDQQRRHYLTGTRARSSSNQLWTTLISGGR